MFLIDVLYGPAGAERNLIQVASSLNKEKFNPVICCLRGGDFINEFANRGLTVVNLNISRIYEMNALLKLFHLYGLLRREHIKIIVSYHKASDYYGLLAGKLFKVPIIISNRRDMGFKLKDRHIFLYRIFNRLYTRIIVVCDALKSVIIEREGANPLRIVTIPNGVGEDNVFDCKGLILQEEPVLDAGKATVAKIANLRKIKGHKFFLDAASLVKKEYPDVQFLMVGSDLKEPESSKDYLSRYAEEVGISDNVIFAGFNNNIERILRQVDVAVSASLSEGCSNVILESMRCAKPVVATSVGGNAELVEDGVNGYLVKAKDSDAMAKAMLKILKDKELGKKLGENGYKKFLDNFTERKMIGEYEKLFESLLKEKSEKMEALETATGQIGKRITDFGDFKGYEWCLCPLLSLGETLTRIDTEIRKTAVKRDAGASDGTLNIYLLLSAIHQIVSDFLIRGSYDFSKLTEGFSFLRSAVGVIHRVNQYCIWLQNYVFDSKLQKFLTVLEKLQSEVAECLVESYQSGKDMNLAGPTLDRIQTTLRDFNFPRRLLLRRLKLPSGFRSFPLTHIDIFRLGKKHISVNPGKSTSIKVLGLRSTGSYIAPLMAAFLKKMRLAEVNFMTIRPKSACSIWERRELKELGKSDEKVLITDDPPTSGKTLGKTLNSLGQLGVSKERIVLLIPEYPFMNEWSRSSVKEPFTSVGLIKFPYEEWYVNDLVSPDKVKEALRPYFERMGMPYFQVDPRTAYASKINQMIGNKHRMGAREKKIYEIIFGNGNCSKKMYVLAKSVGWGWFGYHAVIAGTRLKRFVPEILAFKDGILFTEWVVPQEDGKGKMGTEIPSTESVAEYISERTRELRLQYDPSPGLLDREIGWADIANVMSGVYTRTLGKIKRFNILKVLVRSFPCNMPTMIDGKMGPEKWVLKGEKPLKVDFEEHGFDNSDLSVVDPTYDLASAIFEYKLDGKREADLVDKYRELSGDTNLERRLFFHKILYGHNKLYESVAKIDSMLESPERFKHDASYSRALEFLGKTTRDYLTDLLGLSKAKEASDKLFVIDIDGILDDYTFLFPSPSPIGVEAVKMLKDNGYSIIFNSGRSLEEIKEYCRCYGAIGGIAEYGAVIWDNLKEKSKVLVSEKEIEDCERLKRDFSGLKGVFVSPFHHYTVRAYVYKKLDQRKVDKELVWGIIERSGLSDLREIKGVGKTELVSASIDKGSGLRALIEFMNLKPVMTVAMGDSEPDIPMFECSDISFAPRNHSKNIEALAKKGKVRIVKGVCQKGLFNAVKLLLNSSENEFKRGAAKDSLAGDDLVARLLSVKNKPIWLKLLSFLQLDTLRTFHS